MKSCSIDTYSSFYTLQSFFCKENIKSASKNDNLKFNNKGQGFSYLSLQNQGKFEK